jgi:hypothetical protein
MNDRSAVARFFDDEGCLTGWPAKERDRLPLLQALAARFALDRDYGEREVNEMLCAALHTDATDHVTLRRFLIDYGYLARDPKGTRYWRVEQIE